MPHGISLTNKHIQERLKLYDIYIYIAYKYVMHIPMSCHSNGIIVPSVTESGGRACDNICISF